MNTLLKNIRFYPLACLLALLCGCDSIHEFPHDIPITPVVDDENLEITITLNIDMSFSSDTILQTYATMLETDYDIRYIVDIYEASAGSVSNRVIRIVKTENNMITKGAYHIQDTLKLPIKDYRIITWIDFVEKGTVTDKYYNTDNLQKISIIQRNGEYQGYNSTKDAFTDRIEMDLRPYENQRYLHYDAFMDLIRPFAVYRIITTDISEYATYHQTASYASFQPSKTALLYNLFFPMGYNAYVNAPDNFQAGIHYSSDIVEVVPGKEAILASDFVFVEDDAFYLVDFEVFSAENEHINTVNGLRINLERNKMTVIRSEFLTKNLDNGSVGIDDTFEDEIIIRI